MTLTPGMRVELTDEGLAILTPERPTNKLTGHGVVVRLVRPFGPDRRVIVHDDGHKNPETFAASFWQPEGCTATTEVGTEVDQPRTVRCDLGKHAGNKHSARGHIQWLDPIPDDECEHAWHVGGLVRFLNDECPRCGDDGDPTP